MYGLPIVLRAGHISIYFRLSAAQTAVQNSTSKLQDDKKLTRGGVYEGFLVAPVLSMLWTMDDNHLQLLSMTFAMVMISILLRSNETRCYS